MNDDSSSRIAERLRQWAAGAAPGTRLPSTRALVAEHGASPVTVQRALRTLTTQGLIETRPGVGTFLRGPRTARPSDYGWQSAALGPRPPGAGPLSSSLRTVANDVIALHSGYPARDLLPERLVRTALSRAARGDSALARPPVTGMPELQQWFADELGAQVPPEVTPATAGDVIVLPGSQSCLSAVFRALVTQGQPLLMESPTYWGARHAAEQAGVAIVPVPSGPHGPDPEQLDRAFEETGARLVYAQPTYANPTGAQWSRELGEQVLDVVRRHRAFVLEDDWAHDLGIDTEPRSLAADDDAGHVIYLRSLTKSVSPAIRIAAVVARGPARDRILSDIGASSMYVSGTLQAAALDVVTQPGWQPHLRRTREALRGRRDLLLAGLREHAPLAHVEHVPPGGLNLWARLPDGTAIDRLVDRCRAEGLVISPGGEWFPAEPSAPFVRLNYSGPNPSAFAAGARILGRALEAGAVHAAH